jgi:putative peptidoglycan binding protein
MPRRRRGARAVEVEADDERGLALLVLLRSPKDMVAGALAFAAVSAIIANALWLQTGHHPAPMFGAVAAMPAAGSAASSPLPRPRPFGADESVSEPKPADPLANLVKAAGAAPAASANALRPPAPVPVSSRAETIANAGSHRVAAVQRALTEYGYGQLKPTGTVGSDTQAAIQKFERERKIPVTGQMSDRLVRELTAMIGRPID